MLFVFSFELDDGSARGAPDARAYGNGHGWLCVPQSFETEGDDVGATRRFFPFEVHVLVVLPLAQVLSSWAVVLSVALMHPKGGNLKWIIETGDPHHFDLKNADQIAEDIKRLVTQKK